MKYYKNLSIDENDYSVQRQGCRIHLTTTEYQLFITLLDHSGHICSRNFLLASAWNITVPIQTRTVDVHIAKLRKKLDLGPDDLKTVMGRGYALSVWAKQEIKICKCILCDSFHAVHLFICKGACYAQFCCICSLNGDVNDIDKLRKTSDKVNDTLFGVAASYSSYDAFDSWGGIYTVTQEIFKKLPSLQRHA